MQSPRKRAKSFNKYFVWGFVSGAVALALPFLLLLPKDSTDAIETSTPGGEFRAKGRSGPAVIVQSSCAPECKQGESMIIRLVGAVPSGYVAAYAENENTRIWYFPSNAGEPLRVEGSSDGQLLPKGITLGQEHMTGRYKVSVFLTQRPLSRQQISAQVVRHELAPIGIVPLEIVP